MVDRADLSTINNLISENRMITRAIRNFDEGGRITGFTIGPDSVTIPAEYIGYPPPMVDAIKQAITQRRSQIQQQLNTLGVTGEDPQWGPDAPQPVQPAPAQVRRHRQR